MTEQHHTPSADEALVLIERLVQFAVKHGLAQQLDRYSSRNALLDLFGFIEASSSEAPEENLEDASTVLEQLLDYAVSIGLLPDPTTTARDLLDARIMGLLMPRPSETAARFQRLSSTEGTVSATDDFYRLNIDSNYIRMDRIARNEYWKQPTEYGQLEITINLSKPEMDPKEIARLKTMGSSHYPKCLLCVDNVGYAGRLDHPARQNLRVIPLDLCGEQWYFQYSPYAYYNEHSIVFKGKHEPMRISDETFARLLDFVDEFPHYFIGSNADLPIVGGSILSHDHFQTGRHVFPMAMAPVEASFIDASEKDVRYGIVAWPISVVRVNGTDKAAVWKAACRLLAAWRAYSDPSVDIVACSNQDGQQVPHNTITPIARMRDNGEYELDLALRNNRTTTEFPSGIFHPHSHLHHIKKENIGLIEVMGLAILPGRLQAELEEIEELLIQGSLLAQASAHSDSIAKHEAWICDMSAMHGNRLTAQQAKKVVQDEVGRKYLDVLKDAGVYKRTPDGLAAFKRFLFSLNLVSESQ